MDEKTALAHQRSRKESNNMKQKLLHKSEPEPPQFFTTMITYWVYMMSLLAGILRDLFAMVFTTRSRFFKAPSPEYAGYPPIINAIDSFYSRRLFFRYRDVWNRPITGAPGPIIDVVEREADPLSYKFTWKKDTRKCLNLGSYNYLGFGGGEEWNIHCKDSVLRALESYGASTCAPRDEGGLTSILQTLEERIADFVGKPSALVFSMGYDTNASGIPALIAGKGSLIVSDSLNHTSIVNGSRGTDALIRVFRHNNWKHLDQILRDAILEGQPRTRRPFKKILVIVEGIYSMEGETCRLREIVQVCKKYKAYLYVDEAHSIGALGKGGRGICEHAGVDPADIDILMGTFTKSFGAMGGYIAGSKDLIDFLKCETISCFNSTSMSPPVCQQVITALDIICGKDGTDIGSRKLQKIKDNANFVREELIRMGCEVLGDRDSPIIPLMLYIPTKIALFSRLCLERNLAVVVVGFPAVPLNAARARICISAGHSKEQLQEAVEKLEQVVDILKLRYTKSIFG